MCKYLWTNVSRWITLYFLINLIQLTSCRRIAMAKQKDGNYVITLSHESFNYLNLMLWLLLSYRVCVEITNTIKYRFRKRVRLDLNGDEDLTLAISQFSFFLIGKLKSSWEITLITALLKILDTSVFPWFVIDRHFRWNIERCDRRSGPHHT